MNIFIGGIVFSICFLSLFSHVDEYVSSYVVRIVEELGFESCHEELFDVESFSEMLTAYFPEFISVPHVSICNWIFQLSDKALQNEKGKWDL